MPTPPAVNKMSSWPVANKTVVNICFAATDNSQYNMSLPHLPPPCLLVPVLPAPVTVSDNGRPSMNGVAPGVGVYSISV